jgi:3-hydroxyisobutyrate dehydrogenase
MTGIVMKVGFIGLGHMGLPMARRLIAGGFPVTVWNRTRSRAASLTLAGAKLADSPQMLAAQCDVVITMLSDARAARTIMCGDNGTLATSRPGSIAVDMSTIGPQAARGIAAEAALHGVEFLDAPISGSVALAEQGSLTVMAGGSRTAFDRVRPVLAALSNVQLHLGPSGAGAAMKLAVNLVVAATNQSIAESLVLAEACGIDRAAAYDALASSAISSPFISYKRESYLRPDSTPASFTAALMSKDLGLAIAVAGDMRFPVAKAAKEFLDLACDSGLGDVDFACVAQVLREALSARPRADSGAIVTEISQRNTSMPPGGRLCPPSS